MGNIIQFHKTNRQLERRGNTMYEELVADLQSKPANSYTIKEAEKLADKVLEIGGFEDQDGPTPVVTIAANFGFSAFQEKNMDKRISGNIYIGGTTSDVYGTNQVIVVGDDEEYFHQRFIVAHELAHYLMDYFGSSASKNEKILFSRAYLKKDHDTKEEKRADRFAAELLMPAKVFLKQYIKAMEVSDSDRRYVTAYLSEFFETKKSSIQRRMEELTLY